MANATNSKKVRLLTYLLFAIILLFPFGQLTQIPFFSLRLYIHDILVVCLWLILLFLNNFSKLKKNNLFLPTIVFIAVAAVSLLVSSLILPPQEVAVSSLYLLRWIGYLGIGIAAYVVTQNDLKLKQKIFKGLLLAGTAASVMGLVQYVLYPDLRNLYYLGWDPHFLRVFGTFFDPNFLGLIITLTLILLTTTKSIKNNYVKILFWLINGCALALTYSRGSYVAFFTAFLTFFYVQKKRKLILIMVCIALGILLILPQSGKSEGVNLTRLATIQSRIQSINDGLTVFSRSPFLGIGFNTLHYYQTSKPQVFQGEVIPNNASAGIENSFVFALATTGIVGLIAYLWLLRNMFIQGETVVRISLIAVCVHSLFNNSLFYPWVLIWLWFMVGTSLSVQSASHSRHHQ